MKTMLETRPLDSTLFREMVQCFPEGRLWFSVHEIREKKNGVYERMRSHSLTASQQCFHCPLKASFSRLRLLRLTAVVSWRGSCRICAFWYYVPELSAGLCLNRFSPFMMIFFRRVALSSKFSYTGLVLSGSYRGFRSCGSRAQQIRLWFPPSEFELSDVAFKLKFSSSSSFTH